MIPNGISLQIILSRQSPTLLLLYYIYIYLEIAYNIFWIFFSILI